MPKKKNPETAAATAAPVAPAANTEPAPPLSATGVARLCRVLATPELAGLRIVPRKVCRICGEEKPVTAFYRQKGMRDSIRNECKQCSSRFASESWSRRSAPERETTERCCQRCETVKPLAEFAADTRCVHGRRSTCLTCEATHQSRRKVAPESLEAPDEEIGLNTPLKELRTDLGIAIAHATCRPGQTRTLDEIAAYADVTGEAIRLIERRALRKVYARACALLRAAGIDSRTLRPSE